MNASKYLAEIVGTFVLVFVGSLSILAALAMDASVLLVVPLGFGLALLAGIFAVGDVSGGHFNPAVTLAALLDRRIRILDAVMYVVAQALGAVAASGAILAIASQDAVRATANHPGASVGDTRAFALEVVLTAIFVLVILTVTKRDPAHAPIAIPLTLAVIHFAGIPVSGASVNPVRSLGPALVGADFSNLWIYLTAPFAGAVIGWVLFRVFERAEL